VTLSWLPGTRKLFVGWRDRRCCGGTFDDDYQQWVRLVKVGLSGALRLGPGVEFSEGPQAPTTSERGALEPDEFQGLAATRLGVGLTWSQQTGSVDHLMFRRVPLSAWR
jgi:hypothetical protein